MSSGLHLFEKHEWLGHFWYPDSTIEFAGKLKYSPENGVQLEYLCNFRGDIGKTSHLFGVLENGKSCTLVGDFDPKSGGFSTGGYAVYRGTKAFKYCIFGTHASPEALFPGVCIDFSHFQEFCYPQGFKATARWDSEPKTLFTSESIELAIVQSGSFEPIGPFYANRFLCENKQLLADIDSFFRTLGEKYSNDSVYSRTDVRWLFRIRRLAGAPIGSLIDDMFSIGQLLSLLLFYPVSPIEITVKQAREDGKFDSLDMLMGIANINNETLEFFRREPSNFHMPIKMSNINASKVFGSWWQLPDRYGSFVPKIAEDFGTRTNYETRAEIVLLIAQLEKIAQELGGDHGRRFEYPISYYGSTELVKLIRDALLLADASNDIGSRLSELRGEIAHFGRPIKLLHRLSTVHLITICRCLDLVVASHIYKQLGIEDNVVGVFQENHIAVMRRFLSLAPKPTNQ